MRGKQCSLVKKQQSDIWLESAVSLATEQRNIKKVLGTFDYIPNIIKLI